MEGEFIAYEEGGPLRVRFPVRERYQNPVGFMQGGLITAAVDNTMGPLSYLVAPPGVTTELATSFLRPVTPRTAYIEVEARVVARAGRQLYLSAQVFNPDGGIVAVSRATFVVRRAREDAEGDGRRGGAT